MRLKISALLLLLCAWCSPAQAVCADKQMMNPVTDVAWDCVFPISIMGVPLDFGDHPPDDPDGQMFCQCPGKGLFGIGFGFMVSFWEPARLIETVADPWCFPALGMDMSEENGPVNKGSVDLGQDTMLQGYHYYIMPLWAIMGLFTDLGCDNAAGKFDLAMVSEIRPDWHDDMMALTLFPETALFANPVAIMACAADAIASNFQRPLDALYWCMGTWDTTYPATGNVKFTDYAEGNAAVAGRAMFFQARTAMLPDRAVNYCATTPMPIWVKTHWRLQELDPIVDPKCHAIGHAGLLWQSGKFPVWEQNNFSWLLFRKVRCCVVLGL